MTWTSAFGRACGSLLRVIVNRMALARISPNVLTFMGLLINVAAAILFGYGNAENQARLFRYAGLVVFAAGFFDMVDGRVARATNQVTRFGAFSTRSSTAIAMPLFSSGCWSIMPAPIASSTWYSRRW